MSVFNWDSEDKFTAWDIYLDSDQIEEYRKNGRILDKEGILYLDHPDLPISRIITVADGPEGGLLGH